MARGRHPHAYAIAGAQAVIRAIQNGAKSGTAPVPRPTYQTIHQTDGGNLVAVRNRSGETVTFDRLGISHSDERGDEMFSQPEYWATLPSDLVAHYLATGVFQAIN